MICVSHIFLCKFPLLELDDGRDKRKFKICLKGKVGTGKL